MQLYHEHYNIVWRVRRLFRAMTESSNTLLADFDLSACDRAVLEFLYPDEILSVPEIAERYQVSRQHIQVTINALTDARLLRAQPNPRHRRSPLFELTAAGKQLFRKVRGRETRLLKKLFADIGQKEQTVTAETLSKLLDRFADLGPRSES